RSHPADSIVRKLYALLAEGHRRMGQTGPALAACRAGRAHYPDDGELLYLEGQLHYDLGSLAEAEGGFLRLPAMAPGAHIASLDTGRFGYRARQMLALVRRRQGRTDDAQEQWQAIVAERPGFAPAWRELGEFFLEQGRWAELEQAVRQLRQCP